MKYQTRGKIYLVVGIAAVIYAAVYAVDFVGFAIGIVAGVLISWSYWYWWRDYILKLFKINKKN